jgi:hypothetical protein
MATNPTVLLPIGAQSPAIRNASSPFDSPDADVILRSADKVEFRVFKMFIAFASPIFKDIFALPRASKGKSAGGDEMKDHLPIIQMTESSRTIEILLKLCYPVFTSKLPELNVEDVIALWEAADKYGIEDVTKYARDALLAPPLIEQEAVRIFAIACQNRWEREARMAARYTLRRPLLEREYVTELEHITAGDLHRLSQYHLECLKHVRTIFTDEVPKWTGLPGCNKCVQYLVEERRYARHGWWVRYKQRTNAALAERMCGQTVCTPEFMYETLKDASACTICFGQQNIVHDLSEFGDRLAAEIERVISTVSGTPNPTPNAQAVKLLIGPPGLAIRDARRISETSDE